MITYFVGHKCFLLYFNYRSAVTSNRQRARSVRLSLVVLELNLVFNRGNYRKGIYDEY